MREKQSKRERRINVPYVTRIYHKANAAHDDNLSVSLQQDTPSLNSPKFIGTTSFVELKLVPATSQATGNSFFSHNRTETKHSILPEVYPPTVCHFHFQHPGRAGMVKPTLHDFCS